MKIHDEQKLKSSVATAAALLLLLFLPIGSAQSSPDPYFSSNFNPSTGVIIVVVVAAFLFMGFFSIYVRLCSDPASSSAGSLRGFTITRTSRRSPLARGLDPEIMSSFPTFEYGTVKARKIGKGALECAVCLTEFDDHEIIRMIPKCDHVFHTNCIDTWLAAHTTCPVCRADLVPRDGDEEKATAVEELGSEFVFDHGRDLVIDVVQDDEQEIEHNESMDRPLRLPPPPHELLDLSQRLNRIRTRRNPPKWLGRLITRSNSTGHVAVKRWESMDRFTLRLPDEVRRELITKGKMLTRSASCVEMVPRAPSSRRRNRVSGGEGTGWRGRFGSVRSDRSGRSDRWGFVLTTPSWWLTRWGSMKNGDVAGEAEVDGSRGRV